MRIINKVKINILEREIMPKLDAVQSDVNSRGVEISLLSGSDPWDIPDKVTAAVAYRKPDGTRGLYDELPTGEAATQINGSCITAIFAPEMLTVSGTVYVSVILNDENLNQLGTFPFAVNVSPNPAVGCVVSQNYYKLKNLDEINQAFEELLNRVVNVLDDSRVSDRSTWTSANLVEKLCPSFTESGSVVVCEPVEGYPLAVEWQTKNLINPTAYMRNANSATTLNGDVFTSVTTNGSTYLNTGWGGKLETHPAGTYTATMIPVSEGVRLFIVINSKASGTQLFYKKADVSNGYTLTFTANEEFYLQITGGDSSMWGTHSYKLQLEKGATATAYEPYAETATITRCGKNIAQPPFYGERTANGITVTPHADGKTFTINGTATADATYYLYSSSLYGKKWDVKNGADYTLSVKKLSGSVSSNSVLVVVNYYPFGGNNMRDWMNVRLDTTNRTKSCPADLDRIGAYIYVASGVTCTDLVISYQLEAGNTATDHEQYRESQTFAAGEPITALPGGNTIYADVGNVTVTGKADPVAIINKLPGGGTGDSADAVLYTKQTLTEAQQAQARENIGAASHTTVVEALGEYTEEWVLTDAPLQKNRHWNTASKKMESYVYTNAYVIPCEYGDQFIVSSAAAYNAPCAAFFTGEPSAETYVGIWGETGLGANVLFYSDELVEIPARCKYVCFNDYTNCASHPFYVKKKTPVLKGGSLNRKADAATKSCVEVTYANSELTMRGIDITLVFGITSVNNTFALKNMITPKGEKAVGTDVVSPYVVDAVSNAPSSGFPTGGHHGTENGAGNPTARCESYTIYVDGKAVESADKELCNYVLIDVVNYVEAGNTFVDGSGREVLKEIIHYKFDGSKLYVTTEIEALEEVKIRYYHFIMAVGYSASAIFVGESSKVHTSDFSEDISIDEWIEYAILTDSYGQKLKMRIEKVGLAKHTSSKSTGGSQFITAGGKSACNIVYDWGENAFSMLAGEKTICTGYWDWCPSAVITV